MVKYWLSFVDMVEVIAWRQQVYCSLSPLLFALPHSTPMLSITSPYVVHMLSPDHGSSDIDYTEL